MLSGLIFSREMCPEKNSENFRILQSHNQLSARCLQKTIEASIYKNAKNGKFFDIAGYFFLPVFVLH
jgi:hypothetical protein